MAVSTRVGSVSKLFTPVLLMRLAETGVAAELFARTERNQQPNAQVHFGGGNGGLAGERRGQPRCDSGGTICQKVAEAALTSVFLDTSGWFAAISPKEAKHSAALLAYRQCIENGSRLVTTNLVMAEMQTLIILRARNAGGCTIH